MEPMAKTKPKTIIQPPALDIDAKLGRPGAKGMLERRIVFNLLSLLKAAGYSVTSVWDGEEEAPATDEKSAMETIFNLDEAIVRFKSETGSKHWLYLVLGNGEDVLSDYGMPRGKKDRFAETLDGFDGLDYA
jgi:CheY-like chemotaxis protein